MFLNNSGCRSHRFGEAEACTFFQMSCYSTVSERSPGLWLVDPCYSCVLSLYCPLAFVLSCLKQENENTTTLEQRGATQKSEWCSLLSLGQPHCGWGCPHKYKTVFKLAQSVVVGFTVAHKHSTLGQTVLAWRRPQVSCLVCTAPVYCSVWVKTELSIHWKQNDGIQFLAIFCMGFGWEGVFFCHYYSIVVVIFAWLLWNVFACCWKISIRYHAY